MCIEFHAKDKSGCKVTQHVVKLDSGRLKRFSKVKHLGYRLKCCNNFADDIPFRRGQFIACVNNIMSELGFAHPDCKARLLQMYGYSFYGSSLWDLYDKPMEQLSTTWNIAV